MNGVHDSARRQTATARHLGRAFNGMRGHIEAVRRETAGALSDVRSSRGGRFADVIAVRVRELGLSARRIGLLEVDPRHGITCPSTSTTSSAGCCPMAADTFIVTPDGRECVDDFPLELVVAS